MDRHRAQGALTGDGDLDCGSGIGRRAVCDRQHSDESGAAGLALDGKNNYARPVFLSLFPSGLVLVVPEIGIGDDEAGLRVGIGMHLRYLGSRSLSRWAWRGSMREVRIASTFSSGNSAVAKLRRLSRKRLNSSYSSGPTK